MRIKAFSNKCSGCGDDMIFNPDLQCLECQSCHTQKNIVAKNVLPKHDYNSKEKSTTDKNEKWSKELKCMQCPNCGAKTMLNSFTRASACPYCTTPLIASIDEWSALKPDSVVPFTFGKSKAEIYFKENIKKKFFIPGNLKKSIKSDEINALYFPSFVFDFDAISDYKGSLYNEYSQTEKDGSSTTKKKYFTISGTVNTKHTNIEIEASNNLSQHELNAIKPYNLKEAKEFNNEFIYGYSLENYNASIEETIKHAKTITKQDIRKQILHQYSYDGVSYLDISSHYLNEKYNYTILPLYRINYSYKNKSFSNIMNGQTGKLYGTYPKSIAKILFIVFSILAVVAIPIIIILISFLGAI